MKIYLAARYSRFAEMQGYAFTLQRYGHVITARWISGDHKIDDQGLSIEAKRSLREQFAIEDLSDVCAADLIISFTEVPRSSNSRGGRHVELGIGIGLGKKLMVVGHRENIFHCLPVVQFFATWEECVHTLTRGS